VYITLDFSRPRKPTDDAYVERFNASVRMECLGRHWFMEIDAAAEKVQIWRRKYNEVRPHSAIGNKTPMELLRMAASPASRPSEEARIFQPRAVQGWGQVHYVRI